MLEPGLLSTMRAIFTDIHFVVPFCILIAGVVLLIVLH